MAVIAGSVASKSWPLAVPQVIARSRCTHIDLICVTLKQGGYVGRGEGFPNVRYGETPASEIAKIQDILSRQSPERPLDALVLGMRGAARNALDCALWDLKAKQQGSRIWALLGQEEPKPISQVYTIPFGHPDMMAAAAVSAVDRGCGQLKLKGGDADDVQRVRAVRNVAPDATLILDANEAWDAKNMRNYLDVMAEEKVALVEQPLPADRDNALSAIKHSVPICADESCMTVDDIPRVARLYEYINVKLDKAGGLTAALELVAAAKKHGLKVMVSCMQGTSLAMAPATMLAGQASYIDLDGRLLLAQDYEPPLKIERSMLYPPEAALWG